MTNLKSFELNVYSQNGEDGVLKEVFERLSREIDLDRWCVEFGAWDGIHLSNTCRLIREENYSAVLIEGEHKRCESLKLNYPQERVIKICCFVGFEGNNTLDIILSSTVIPRDFDLLSIDIDGADYYILESIEKYSPKVVCIEFNPSIPNCVDFVQEKKFDVKQGASAKALTRLAKDKGYWLAHVTHCNLILVRQDLFKYVLDDNQSLENLNPSGNDPTYVFVGYDGSILSNKVGFRLNWHGLDVSLEDLQPLPKCLRVYRGDYGFFRKIFFLAWLVLFHPLTAVKKVRKNFGDDIL